MAQKKNESSADKARRKAELEKAHAKAQKEREKARRKRERDMARHEKAVAEAKKRAAEEREKAEALKNDPAYQEKQKREAEKLMEKGRKEREKAQKRSAKKAEKAQKQREKAAAGGLAGAKRAGARAGRQDRPVSDRVSANTQAKIETAHRDRKRSRISLVAVVVIAVLAAILLFPPQDKITMGLDIQGGVSVNLDASKLDGSAVTQEDMDLASQVITSRVNASGASAASVQQQGSTGFLVQVPGASENSQAILDTLSSQGVLEFVDVTNGIKDEKVQGYIEQGLEGMNLKEENIEYEPFMTGESVTQTTVDRPQGSSGYAVNLKLDSAGTKSFADVSSALVSDRGQIAILLDGEVKSAPHVNDAITTGEVQITGNYSVDEANQLKTIISSGSLPVSLEIQQASTVGPTLGQNALRSGIVAAIIGLVLVIIWLLLFYNGLGLLTGVSIVIMAIIYLGVLAGLSLGGLFSLTLPGIAGIIVNIGLSADSSILIMECFHEQIREGKSFKTAARNGVREGIMTSLDADIVTLVSALVLYFVAIGDVRGFGLTLALGICCDLIVMALFSGPIIRILGPRVIARHPGFWGMRDDMNEGNYIASEQKRLVAREKGAATEAKTRSKGVK